MVLVGAAAFWFLATRAPEPVAPGTTSPEDPSRSNQQIQEPAAPDRMSIPPAVVAPVGASSPDDSANRSSAVTKFEEHLVDHIAQNYSEGSASVLVFSTGISTNMVATDKDINPDGKVLTKEQMQEVAALADKFRTLQQTFGRQDLVLTGQALMQSVAMGQYLASDPRRPLPGGDSAKLLQEGEAQRTRQREAVQSTHDALTARLGTHLKDWASTVLGTAMPDRTTYKTTIWYTKEQAPELFANRQQMMDAIREERRELKAYFASLPK